MTGCLAIWIFAIATTCVESYATLPANSACFATKPGTGDRSATTIKLGVRNWVSHRISSALLEIALKEYLRYTVSLIDLSSAPETDWGKDLSNGDFDIDIEAIYGAPADDGYAQYVTTDAAVVVAGNPGYFRRKGLFTTPGVVNNQPLSTWYEYYKDATSVGGAGFKMYSTAEAASLQSAAGNSWPLCTYSWCGTGALTGFWTHSSACQSTPTSCALALLDTPGASTSTARYEQLAANHGMILIYAYLGSALEQKVKEIANAGDNVIFSWWMPDGLPVSLNAQRIAFPDYFLGCVDTTTQTPSGTSGCDFPDMNLYKLMAKRLRNSAPEAYLLVQNFRVFISSIESMMKNTTSGGGTMTPHAAACQFLKGNNATVSGWVPACIITPPAVPQSGDFTFDSFSMACKQVLAFPEIGSPVCYSSAAKPAKVDRSHILIKPCYQYWLSHQIIQAIAAIILKDFLGYSVTLVDVTSWATNQVWETLDGAACDFDLESWQAAGLSTNAKYNEFVVEKQSISNPGVTGFDGRTSNYITPDLETNSDMASYWKFYKAGRDLSNVNMVHYGQLGQTPTYPATMQTLLGSAFPRCLNNWCPNSNSSFHGYYVPQTCIANPTKCVIAMMHSSSWDSGYFETLVNTLQLQIIFAYYGSEMTSTVKEVVANKTTNTIFYWWEPDPFITSTSAIRISYPDTTYGCTEHYYANPNPNVGKLACDQPTLVLQKLVRTSVRDQMPEAYSFLRNMLVSKPQVNAMMGMHVQGGGTFASHNDSACEWVKQNEAMILADWAQKCIVDPVVGSVAIGDSVFNTKKFQCETVSCLADQVIIPGTSDCKTCGAGQMPNQAKSDCTACPAGTVPNRSEANYSARCSSCKPGYFCSYGAEEAFPCAKGTFRGASQDPLECIGCEEGKYQTDEGRSGCVQCPLTMTGPVGAKAATSCICPAEMYKPLNATDINGLVADPNTRVCKACPAGMTCSEGSDAVNIPCSNGQKLSITPAGKYPVPLLGNYVNCENPLSCFACLTDTACPGLAVEACTGGMVGIACGGCVDGWYKSRQVCAKCNDVETSNLIFPVVPLLVAPIGIAIFYKFSQDTITKWYSAANSLAAATFVTLIYIQTLAAISTCYVMKPQVVRDHTDWVEFTYDLLSMLRPDCTTFTDFKLSFIGRILLPVYAFVLFFFDFGVSRVVGMFLPIMKMDFDMTMNCFMAVFNTFFIGIAQQTFTLFQCYKHPNGKTSLRSQPDVLCGSDDWQSLVVVAVVAVVFFCGGFICLNIYIIIVAPTKFDQPIFRKRWKFLFIKFRPSAWWWGLVLLIKGVWVNLPTVVFDYGAAQILWLQSAILSYLIGCFVIDPWRTFMVSALDMSMHSCLCFLFGFVTHFVEMGESSAGDLGTAYSLFANLPVAFGGCLILFFFYRRIVPPKYDWHSAAKEVTTIFGQMAGQTDKLAMILPHLPFADIITLNRAKQLMQIEMGIDRKPKTLSDHRLLTLIQRGRLFSQTVASDKGLAGTEVKSEVACSVPEVRKEDDTIAHESISKLRKLIKPDEVWLCSALEMAVEGRRYDVDALRGTSSNGRPDEMDDLNIPAENMLYDHFAHGMLSVMSPRAAPPQGVATPRSQADGTPPVTPREPFSAIFGISNSDTPLHSPRGATPPGTPRALLLDAPMSPRGNTPMQSPRGNTPRK